LLISIVVSSFILFTIVTGVSKEWWREAAAEHNWDVDIDSISTEDVEIWRTYERYNVVMRKRNQI
jgi:hypothetical protein